MTWPVRVVRLASDPRESGLLSGADGLSLGGRPLLRKTATGFTPRPLPEIQDVFDGAYGGSSGLDAEDYLPGLASVSRCLTNGDLPLAMIGSLLLKLPETPDLTTRQASGAISKDYNEDQPRDERGRWTNGSAGTAGVSQALLSTAARLAIESVGKKPPLIALAPETIPLLIRLAAVSAGPVALAVGLLIPFNRSNITSGEFPGFPGLNYQSDEGVLTISRLDPAGNVERLYHGLPDQEGFYRDAQGLIIGRHVGTAVLFDPEALDELAGKPSPPQQVGTDFAPLPGISPAPEDDEPKVCPPPTPEDIAGRSARALAYQSQITGLPIGFDMLYHDIRFDGCDELTKRMQEAKGLMGYYLNMMLSNDLLRETKFYSKIMGQAERQNAAARDRGVDWYFAEQKFADFFSAEFKRDELVYIKVHQEDAIVTKIEDCITLVNTHLNAWVSIQKRISGSTLATVNIQRTLS
jgi:hypothetical protein